MTSENTTDWIFSLLTKTGDKTTINSVSFWQPGKKQKTSVRDNCSEMRVLSIIIVRKQITQYKRGMSRAMDQVSWRYCLFIWSACVASREGKKRKLHWMWLLSQRKSCGIQNGVHSGTADTLACVDRHEEWKHSTYHLFCSEITDLHITA